VTTSHAHYDAPVSARHIACGLRSFSLWAPSLRSLATTPADRASASLRWPYRARSAGGILPPGLVMPATSLCRRRSNALAALAASAEVARLPVVAGRAVSVRKGASYPVWRQSSRKVALGHPAIAAVPATIRRIKSCYNRRHWRKATYNVVQSPPIALDVVNFIKET